MQVTIENHGEKSIRVIIDKDTINDHTLAPGESTPFETQDEGTIELRELGE